MRRRYWACCPAAPERRRWASAPPPATPALPAGSWGGARGARRLQAVSHQRPQAAERCAGLSARRRVLLPAPRPRARPACNRTPASHSTRRQLSAECIAALARGHASDPDFPSPYTREALQQG
jgi:hypothetical protein